MPHCKLICVLQTLFSNCVNACLCVCVVFVNVCSYTGIFGVSRVYVLCMHVFLYSVCVCACACVCRMYNRLPEVARRRQQERMRVTSQANRLRVEVFKKVYSHTHTHKRA